MLNQLNVFRKPLKLRSFAAVLTGFGVLLASALSTNTFAQAQPQTGDKPGQKSAIPLSAPPTLGPKTIQGADKPSAPAAAPAPAAAAAAPQAQAAAPAVAKPAAPVAAAVPAAAKPLVTAGGVKYEDSKVGTGAIAEKGKTVTVHYTGWLLENGKLGRKFDSSVDRGEPFKFPLGGGRVIKGWDEGVAGMKVGGTRVLTIPPEMGYGARGAGAVIPPGATLVFEVKLLGV